MSGQPGARKSKTNVSDNIHLYVLLAPQVRVRMFEFKIAHKSMFNLHCYSLEQKF